MSNSFKKMLVFLFLLMVFAALLAGCSAKDPLLGTWKEPNSGVVFLFAKGGKLTMSKGGPEFVRDYELQEPNVMIFKGSEDGKIGELRMIYRIEGEKLIITADGIDSIFEKVNK